MARLGLCSAILAMLVGGCGGSARDATAEAKPSVPLYSEGAAAAVADALLAAVPLPANTQHISEAPQAVAGKLGRAGNSEDSAKAVDRHAYWSSTDRPEAIISFIAKKGPIPKVAYGSYGASKTEGLFDAFDVPLGSPLAGPRQLFVSIALDGSGRYAVRVDAVVAWHERRPASSLVPATARWPEGDDYHTGLSCPESRRTLARSHHKTHRHHHRPKHRSGGSAGRQRTAGRGTRRSAAHVPSDDLRQHR
jgi:hypothetical protein